nr:ATP-dependent helicase [Candidatus Sigynarchaeota archaeon]
MTENEEKPRAGSPPGPRKFVMKAAPVRVPEKYKRELNAEQLKAATHGNGPALVIAGAGSGKTRVLTYRVAWLVETGADARGIMLVTFTRKAADEMTSRVEKLVGISKDTLIAGTFHHVAGLFLRRYAKHIKYQENFTILDRDDEEQLFKKVLGAYLHAKQDELKKRFPTAANLSEIYSKSVNLQKSVASIVATAFPQYSELTKDIEGVLQQYAAEKRKQNAMDFDDMLVYFLALIHMEHVGDEIKNTVKHVLVDEYQDVNQIQADITIALGEKAKSVMVVGDDAQAIYAFRGSEIKHILEFPKHFTTPVTTYYLVENYRSTPEIIAFANASIKHNKKQYPKELRTENQHGDKPAIVQCETKDEEANFICQYILKARDEGIPLHDQAVLFRTAFQSQVLEKTLVHYNIPYEVRSGIRFYEKAHIKDLLCFAFVIMNPSYAIAWERILTLLPGMGTRSAEKVMQVISPASNPLVEFITMDAAKALQGMRVEKAALTHIAKMQAVYRELVLDKKSNVILPEDKLPLPAALLEKFLAFYEPYLKARYPDYTARIDDLKEIVGLAARYQSLSAFLGEVAISETFIGQTGMGTPDTEEQPLVLSTVHQAKGLEWTNVHVMGVVEDMFPHSRSKSNEDDFEEERRMFYVACTRAKKTLVISYPVFNDAFPTPGRSVIWQRSSFIDEIEADNVFEKLLIEHEKENL